MTPIILWGTDVIKGNGKALIICVGERSTKGKIRRMVDNSKDEKVTPLQEKLDVLAKKISTFAIFAGIATFVCLTINLIYGIYIFLIINYFMVYEEQLMLGAQKNRPNLNNMNIMTKKWIDFIPKFIYSQKFWKILW